jgi:hypothetical protein
MDLARKQNKSSTTGEKLQVYPVGCSRMLWLGTLSWPFLAVLGHALPDIPTILIDNKHGGCRFSLIISQDYLDADDTDKN